MYYVITQNGLLVGVTKENAYQFSLTDVSIHEFEGTIPDLNSTVWDSVNETLVEDSNVLTRLNFLNRFTITERMTIRASTDPVVIDIMKLLEVAEYVDLTDTNTIQGVGYLASVGLITTQRAQEILS